MSFADFIPEPTTSANAKSVFMSCSRGAGPAKKKNDALYTRIFIGNDVLKKLFHDSVVSWMSEDVCKLAVRVGHGANLGEMQIVSKGGNIELKQRGENGHGRWINVKNLPGIKAPFEKVELQFEIQSNGAILLIKNIPMEAFDLTELRKSEVGGMAAKTEHSTNTTKPTNLPKDTVVSQTAKDHGYKNQPVLKKTEQPTEHKKVTMADAAAAATAYAKK